MLQIHTSNRKFAAKIAGALCIGLLSWICLLMAGAKHFANNAHLSRYEVGLGPFTFNTLTSTGQDHGATVGVTFENGLVWYLGCCIVGGVLWELLGTLRGKHIN